MSVSLPNGATISVGSAYGTSTTMLALSNSNPAVATVGAAHGLIVGDIARITSGWSKLNGQVARVSAVNVNDITLEGINTLSTIKFPAGSGIGNLQEVTAFTQITQVLETATQGGDQQFITYSFLEDATERQIPTNKSAQSLTLTIGDDATLPHYPVLSAADDDRLPRAIRILLPSNSPIYYQGYVTLNKTPTITKNQIMGLQATISLIADPIRYAV